MPRRNDRDQRRKHRKSSRSVGTRRERAGAILIVTEGEKTEPIYFRGIKAKIESSHMGTLDIETPVIEVRGIGESTGKLVDKATRINRRSGKVYNKVWVVCDADDFEDLDVSKVEAKNAGMGFVWSNRAFELWLLLHFERCEIAYSTEQLFHRLDRALRQRGVGGYEKAREDLYRILEEHGDLEKAVERAKGLREMHGEGKVSSNPSLCDPCTTVDMLVTHLLSYC